MKLKTFVSVFFSLLKYAAVAQDLSPALSQATAVKVQQGCLDYAKKNNINLAIAIYDAHGQLITFTKMDGASTAVAKIAQWKGLSAAVYQYPTSETANWNMPNAPDIATVPGGLPIKTKDGKPLGGVGVSGAQSAVDVKCAEAGLEAAGLL